MGYRSGPSKHGGSVFLLAVEEHLVEGVQQVRCGLCPSSSRRFLLGRVGIFNGPKDFTGALASHETTETIVPVRPLRTLVGQV